MISGAAVTTGEGTEEEGASVPGAATADPIGSALTAAATIGVSLPGSAMGGTGGSVIVGEVGAAVEDPARICLDEDVDTPSLPGALIREDLEDNHALGVVPSAGESPRSSYRSHRHM